MTNETRALSVPIAGKREIYCLLTITAMFVSALIVSSITASKIYEVSFFGAAVAVPVGTSLFALTFLSTDAASEIWGARIAFAIVILGLFARVGTAAFLYFAVNIEGAPYWSNQNEYASVLTSSSRILIAGIATYPVSQSFDIFVFHRLKKLQVGRNLLWLRNNVSTFLSQSIDSTCFILIAFYGIFGSEVLFSMILGQVLIKWIVAVCDTPFVYLLRNLATGRPMLDTRG